MWGKLSKTGFVVGAVVFIFSMPGHYDDAAAWYKLLSRLPVGVMEEILKYGLTGLGFVLLSLPLIQFGYTKMRMPALEVLYDSSNSRGRFACIDVWQKNDQLIEGYAYRVGVKNNTSKTLRNVHVTVEGETAILFLPASLVFTRTKEHSIDIDPQRMELVDVFLIKGLEGTRSPTGAFNVTIVVSGSNTPSIAAKFWWDGDALPALTWERPEWFDHWQDWVGVG